MINLSNIVKLRSIGYINTSKYIYENVCPKNNKQHHA